MTMGAWNPPLFIPVALALAVATGLATYLGVEKPLLERLRGRLA
jgi:peptidoglycan/LPS O-acetylase OafA/YrhL